MVAKSKINSISKWLGQPLGKYFISMEQQVIDKCQVKMTGDMMLLLGATEFSAAAENIRVNYKLLIHTDEANGINCSKPFLCTRDDKLPIDQASIDIVYLAHVVETAANPHEVLREAYRVLRPEGCLVLSGFNPYSIWGILRWVLRFTGRFPWTVNYMSRLKIKDWLSLLGFEVMFEQSYCYSPPISSASWLTKFYTIDNLCRKLKLPFGAGNVIVAYKREIALTPLRPVWRDPRGVLSNSGVEPVP